MSSPAAYHILVVWMCAMTHLHAIALHSVCMLLSFFFMALIKHIACFRKARRHSSRQPCGLKCHFLYPTISKGPRTLTISLRQMNLDVIVWLSGKVLAQRVAPVPHGCMTGKKNERNLPTSWTRLEVDSVLIEPLCRPLVRTLITDFQRTYLSHMRFLTFCWKIVTFLGGT